MIRGLGGNPDAYRAFLHDLSGYLRAFFRKRLTQRPDDVEDLVQESLLAVHVQRHTYDAAQPLTAWVYAIAKYKFVDLLRRRNNHERFTDSWDDEMEVFASSDQEAADARCDLHELLKQLPDRQRLPIVLMKLRGLSAAEAARTTGMSESAVKVGVHRGLKALAAKLKGGA